MSKSWLEIVFPVGLALLVCTMGIFLLTMGGLIASPEPPAQNNVVATDTTHVEPATSPALPANVDVAAVAAGEELFKSNCAQCHAIEGVVVGPALAGITKRRPVSWLIPWVKNSSKMVASGDEYAVKVFNQYQKQQMPSFQLNDQEIKQILTYVEASESRAVAAN